MRYSTALRAAYAGLMGLLLTAALSAQESIACGMRGAERWQSTRPSPLDSVSIVLRDRIARICYSRPSARVLRLRQDQAEVGSEMDLRSRLRTLSTRAHPGPRNLYFSGHASKPDRAEKIKTRKGLLD